MEYEYTNHMWVICSMYICSIYPMYINVNYFVFPFVYLKDIMEYEYTNHMSIHMLHVHVLYLSQYINVIHKCVCVRDPICLVVISHKRVLGRQSET